MPSKKMVEWNKRESIYTKGEQKIRRERWEGLKELHRKWVDLDFSEKPRLYKGCENCRFYSDRKCQRTGEELTMVCDEWEGRYSNVGNDE